MLKREMLARFEMMRERSKNEYASKGYFDEDKRRDYLQWYFDNQIALLTKDGLDIESLKRNDSTMNACLEGGWPGMPELPSDWQEEMRILRNIILDQRAEDY